MIGAVDHAQRRVAVGHAVDMDAKRHDVGELLEADVLALHLAPDRVGRLLAPGNVSLDAGRAQHLRELGDDSVDQIDVALAQMAQPVQHALAGIGPQLGEGQILELGLEPLHADPLGQRRIDLHGLGGDAAALVGALDEMQRAHVVQPVGELDQEHADVLGHRQQQLAEVLGLGGMRRLQLEPVELGDAVDQPGHGAPEQALDLVQRGAGVLDRVVQQGGGDRGAVELEAGEDARDLDRMVEIGVARGAQLRAMRLHGEHVGPVEQILVGVRIVGPDALDQLVLPDDRAPRALDGRGRRHQGRAVGLDHQLRGVPHRHLPNGYGRAVPAVQSSSATLNSL